MNRLDEKTAERLNDRERSALHRRIAPNEADFEAAATVRDVAEASGLSESDVIAHLRQIRAEAAFATPEETRPSALPWLAGGALVVALGVTAWRLRPQDPLAAYRPDKFVQRLAPSTVPTPTRIPVRSVATTPLLSVWDQTLPTPLSNLTVEAIGQRSQRTSNRSEANPRAMPYGQVRDSLIRSAEALVSKIAQGEEGQAPAPSGTRYHGQGGGIFSPRPGFVRLSMFGWAGQKAGWVAVPLGAAGRKTIRELADATLAEVKREQEAALAAVADPSQGLVIPPPGFSMRFAGRRLDVRQGPRLSFSDASTLQVARRLEATILNAIARDRRPPIGAWSGNAAQEAKIPTPKASRLEILGPAGIASTDVPTAPNDPQATRRAVREFAERTARQIESIERRALGNNDANP